MTKLGSSILLAFALLIVFSCKKREIPVNNKYTITIDSVKKSTDVAKYDTVWFRVSPNDGKKPVVIVDIQNHDGNYSYYSNPQVVKVTNTYIVLSRDFANFNNRGNLQLSLLAYGSLQSSVTFSYSSTSKTSSNLSGKILFRTTDGLWVIWDLKNKKAINSTYSSLNIVDYNNITGQILVLGSNYLQLYDEKFNLVSTSNSFPSLYYAKNLSFTGNGTSVSYFSTYDYKGHTLTFPGTEVITNPESSYSMYNFNASTSSKVYVGYYSGYYYLRYNKNGSSYISAAYSNYNYFTDLSISNYGDYLLFNYDGILRISDLFKGNTTIIENKAINKSCFNSTMDKISFINGSYQLSIYNIASNTIDYPLSGTSYGSYYISYAFW